MFAEHIQELDARIQANLDGLLLYGDDAWAIAQANGEFPQGGEAFCLGYLAFSGEDIIKIQYATEFSLQNPDTFKGLVSALAWLPGVKVHPWVTQFFNSKNLDHKRLALATCRAREEDAAGFLNPLFEREDCVGHPGLLAEALRAVGFFKRGDLAHKIPSFLSHADTQVVFWAIYASLRAGNVAPLELLAPYCVAADEALKPLQQKALLLAMAYLPLEKARSWVGLWVEQGLLRIAIQACGFLGDVASIPWLISQMQQAEFNRIAGEAFYLVTGQQAPAGPPLLTDADEPTAEQLEDDNLPWVDTLEASKMPEQKTISAVQAMRYRTQALFLSGGQS